MQKKKKYYEIKDGGVTLYWDMTANMLVDIDVTARRQNMSICLLKKQYQIIRILHIKSLCILHIG